MDVPAVQVWRISISEMHFERDCTHPSPEGSRTVIDLLLDFFDRIDFFR